MKLQYYNSLREDVLAQLPNQKFKTILEIGGGDFPTLLHIGNSMDSEKWGVDIHLCDNPNIKFIQGSVETHEVKNQIPDNHFDLIIANDVIEHLANTEDFFSFVHKKLSPNGMFVSSIPNIRQIKSLYYIFFRGTFPRHQAGLFDKTHLRWFCKDDVLSIAEKSNFDLIKFKPVGRLVWLGFRLNLFEQLLALQNIFIFRKK